MLLTRVGLLHTNYLRHTNRAAITVSNPTCAPHVQDAAVVAFLARRAVHEHGKKS